MSDYEKARRDAYAPLLGRVPADHQEDVFIYTLSCGIGWKSIIFTMVQAIDKAWYGYQGKKGSDCWMLFILSVPTDGTGKRERVIFDPVMTPIGATRPMDEGCLSFPGIFGSIPRYHSLHIVGKTPEGPIDEEVDGFEAHAVQHEMDHLNGILFTEKMTPADLKLNATFIHQMEANWHRQHPNE